MVEMLSHLVKFAVESAFSDQSKFYVDDDDDCEEEEELLFCKNNVCVHSSLEKEKIPGYFTIKSRTRKSGHIRLIVSWTPNSHLVKFRENTDASDPSEPGNLEVFSVDLSEMKTLKLFYDENDNTCGHFIIGNHENHYKVLHFHCGGLDKITKILGGWDWCVSQKISGDEKRSRRRCFLVTRRVPVNEDSYVEEGRFDPMPYDVWKTLFNDAGQLGDVTNFRRAVFFGGLSPEVRKEAWKFLLFYYSFNSTYEERVHWKSKKEYEYLALQRQRLCMSTEEQDQFWKSVQCTVDKDVPRTDRSHPYFAGSDNPNTEIMRNILLNYAVHNPTVGYNQGMSDLLAPVLAVVQDEVDAFWCFAGLMEASVFVTSPKDDVMDRQLVYLRELVKLLEPRFYAHLLIKEGGLDMLFCHRWLLLCFKREFFNAEVLLMWEACWSRYQTEYFHIFLCVAMMQEYGEEVLQEDMQSDDMLQYFTDLSMKMDGSKVLRKARQLLLKFRQLPFIPCSLRGLLSGPGIWDSAPLPSIECHCHGLCSSSRRHSGSLTDADVDIMNKSKGKIGHVGEEKAMSREITNEELSSSVFSKDGDEVLNCSENEGSKPDKKEPQNQEIPEEELSSSAKDQSSCTTNSSANHTENNECELDEEEKPKNQEVPENTDSATNQSSKITDSEEKTEDSITDPMRKENSKMGDICQGELSSSPSKQQDYFTDIDKNLMKNQHTKHSKSSTDNGVSMGQDGKNNEDQKDLSEPPSSVTEEDPEQINIPMEERPAKRGVKDGMGKENNDTINAEELSKGDTEQNMVEEKQNTLGNHTKHVKDLMSESSKAGIIEVEGMAELASEAIDDWKN